MIMLYYGLRVQLISKLKYIHTILAIRRSPRWCAAYESSVLVAVHSKVGEQISQTQYVGMKSLLN